MSSLRVFPHPARAGAAERAIIAVAAPMLTAVYHMLTRAVPYHDLGGAHFERRDHAKLAQRLVRRLRALGFTVARPPAA